MSPPFSSLAGRFAHRKRWAWGVAVVALLPAVALWWPRSIPVVLPDGRTLEICKLTSGPVHTFPLPITWPTLWKQISRARFDWPTQSSVDVQGSVGIWFTGRGDLNSHQVLLTDRHGWQWMSTGTSWEDGNRRIDVFPPLETGPVSTLEARRDNQWIGGATLSIPFTATAPASRFVSQTPFERTDGPLVLRVNSFEVEPIAMAPSHCRIHLGHEAEWNDRPCRVRIGDMRIVDALGRRDAPLVLRDGAITTTYLSPYIDWNVRLEVYRPIDEPIDESATLVFEPQFGPEGPVQKWDKDIAGTGWRILFSPGSKAVSFSPRFFGWSRHWERGQPVIAIEREPGRPGTPRIEIASTQVDHDGRGREDKGHAGQVTHHVIDITPDANETLWAIDCDALDPRHRHKITIGLEIPRTISFSLRPRITKSSGVDQQTLDFRNTRAARVR